MNLRILACGGMKRQCMNWVLSNTTVWNSLHSLTMVAVTTSMTINCPAYQPNKDAKELDNIRIGHTVEPTEEGVEYCNARWDNHTCVLIHVNDDGQRSTQSGQDTGSPEYLTTESWQEEQSAHSFPKCILKWVKHCDISLFSHLICKENSSCKARATKIKPTSHYFYLAFIIIIIIMCSKFIIPKTSAFQTQDEYCKRGYSFHPVAPISTFCSNWNIYNSCLLHGWALTISSGVYLCIIYASTVRLM